MQLRMSCNNLTSVWRSNDEASGAIVHDTLPEKAGNGSSAWGYPPRELDVFETIYYL
jgi:hypothetical protein